MRSSYKTITVVGPTASGKSDIAIAIAKAFDGAVIGADSRQVYRHMDLGSGKEPGEVVTLLTEDNVQQTHPHLYRGNDNAILSKIADLPLLATPYISSDVPHYMIDIIAPNTLYNGAKFVKKAQKVIDALHGKDILPIVCGGTHFWVQSLIERNVLPNVVPNQKLRKKLDAKSAKELFKILVEKDARRANDIQDRNEQNNRPRLIRAIEIANVLGAVPRNTLHPPDPQTNLILAVAPTKDEVIANITNRLQPRLDAGMLDEVFVLHHEHHVSWSRLESFGLEYKWCTFFLRNQCTKQDMKDGIIRESRQFAKRQRTWLRRWEKQGADIQWITTQKEALTLTKQFLQNQ